jgi:hypothetical protein
MRQAHLLMLLALVLPACTDTLAPASRGGAAPAGTPSLAFPDPSLAQPGAPGLVASPADTPSVQQAPQRGLVVHEWGTFTSMQSSTGVTLDGLQHEEEPLPDFVTRRDPDSRFGKGIEALPEGVTEKLETPVLYFYAAEPTTVRVSVTFPQGIVSEWYPDAASFSPPVGELTAMAGGTMDWEAQLVPGRASYLPVDDTSIWAPARRVASTPVHIGDEAEPFIFYRGLGRFDLPVRVVQADLDHLVLANQSDQDIAAAFLIRLHDGVAAVDALGALRAGAQIDLMPSPKELDIDTYVAEAQSLLRDALVGTGLHADEAQAMVDTWTQSYFRTEGMRILYLVPRAWADELLPMTIEPQPAELVRTLVGRIEVVTRTEEIDLAAEVEAAAAGQGQVDLDPLGRFAEPRLRAALPHLDDPHPTPTRRHIAASPAPRAVRPLDRPLAHLVRARPGHRQVAQSACRRPGWGGRLGFPRCGGWNGLVQLGRRFPGAWIGGRRGRGVGVGRARGQPDATRPGRVRRPVRLRVARGPALRGGVRAGAVGRRAA